MNIPIMEFIFMIVTTTFWISAANPRDAHISTIVSNTFSHQFDILIKLAVLLYARFKSNSNVTDTIYCPPLAKIKQL
jgi:hypothetical protein